MRHWIDWYWEKFWQCNVRGNHLVKMDSHGRCYRCGKQMHIIPLPPYTYVNGPKR